MCPFAAFFFFLYIIYIYINFRNSLPLPLSHPPPPTHTPTLGERVAHPPFCTTISTPFPKCTRVPAFCRLGSSHPPPPLPSTPPPPPAHTIWDASGILPEDSEFIHLHPLLQRSSQPAYRGIEILLFFSLLFFVFSFTLSSHSKLHAQKKTVFYSWVKFWFPFPFPSLDHSQDSVQVH